MEFVGYLYRCISTERAKVGSAMLELTRYSGSNDRTILINMSALRMILNVFRALLCSQER
jgi:hypothetical protein